MSLFTPLKEIRDWFISLFRKKLPALADLVQRLSSDEIQAIMPMIIAKAVAIANGTITLEKAVADVAKVARDVAIKDIRDALGLQSRFIALTTVASRP